MRATKCTSEAGNFGARDDLIRRRKRRLKSLANSWNDYSNYNNNNNRQDNNKLAMERASIKLALQAGVSSFARWRRSCNHFKAKRKDTERRLEISQQVAAAEANLGARIKLRRQLISIATPISETHSLQQVLIKRQLKRNSLETCPTISL